MPYQSAILLSHVPNQDFLKEFQAFLQQHFPEVTVQTQPYSERTDFIETLVFAEKCPYENTADFEQTARSLVLRNNDVFVLSQRLGYARQDLRHPLPHSGLRPGKLLGLAGVIYQLDGDPFQAITLENSGPAEEVLAGYLKR